MKQITVEFGSYWVLRKSRGKFIKRSFHPPSETKVLFLSVVRDVGFVINPVLFGTQVKNKRTTAQRLTIYQTESNTGPCLSYRDVYVSDNDTFTCTPLFI